MSHCSIIKSKGEEQYAELINSNYNIVTFLKKNTNIRLNELVADYIKDSAGIWWFIGVKAFKIDENQGKYSLKPFLPYHENVAPDENIKDKKSPKRIRFEDEKS